MAKGIIVHNCDDCPKIECELRDKRSVGCSTAASVNDFPIHPHCPLCNAEYTMNGYFLVPRR